MTTETTPLDPRTPAGRDLAARLTDVLASIRLAVSARKRNQAAQGRNKAAA